MAQMAILNNRLEACADCRIGIQIGPKSCKPFDGTPPKSAVVPSCMKQAGSTMKRTNPKTREFAHTPLGRSRPLTFAQEVLLIATAFAVGGMLQMLAILHVGGILD